MRNSKIHHEKLAGKLLKIKIGTLMYHLPNEEVVKYNGCDFEVYSNGENYIPIDLHTWIGNNHKYVEKYHRVFPVPDQLRKPLIKLRKNEI